MGGEIGASKLGPQHTRQKTKENIEKTHFGLFFIPFLRALISEFPRMQEPAANE